MSQQTKRKLKFLLLATPVVWLIILLPITVLVSWWQQTGTLYLISLSVLFAPLVSVWIYLSFQTANLAIKWPATQLIGLTTILTSVLIFSSPLLLFLPSGQVALLATVIWILTSIYAIWNAHQIQNTALSVTSDKIDRPYRLMHLSDVHAGSRSRSFVNKAVQQASRQKPEAVLITGDLLDSSVVDHEYLQPLAQFDCPVYLCLGNHERYVDLDNAIESIKANNVHILRNDSVSFQHIQIIGIDDADNPDQVTTHLPKITFAKDRFTILLYHRPQGLEAAAEAGIDLMLCGHTHAGQIWPFGLIVERQFPMLKGAFQHGNATLYVSQGTGTWGPTMRLGTKCEMTLIELTPKMHS